MAFLKFINIKIIIYLNQLNHLIIKFTDLCLLAPTSGSTGSQKYVRQSYKNVIKNTKSIIAYLKINKDHRTITSLPLSYTFGMSIINTHLAVGSLIYLSNFSVLQKNFGKFFLKKKLIFIWSSIYF